MLVWKRRESPRNPFRRATTARLRLAPIRIGVFIAASASVFASIARAHTLPRLQRLKAVHIIQQAAERFFFTARAAGSMLLAESDACLRTQISSTISGKSQMAAF